MTEELFSRILGDIYDAVKAHYGQDGLTKVLEHCRAAERARESNAEIDEIEAAISSGNCGQPSTPEKK